MKITKEKNEKKTPRLLRSEEIILLQLLHGRHGRRLLHDLHGLRISSLGLLSSNRLSSKLLTLLVLTV